LGGVALLELDARQQAAGGEVGARLLLEQHARLGGLAAGQEDARQTERGGGVIGVCFQCSAERLLVTGLREDVRLGWKEGVEEGRDLSRRQGAGELADDLGVAERAHVRDAADAERLREDGVRVHVHLRELHLAFALSHLRLDRGTERTAWAAPFGPEIDHHGNLPRALEHLRLEISLSDVLDHEMSVLTDC
jgi:hypothetical protein